MKISKISNNVYKISDNTLSLTLNLSLVEKKILFFVESSAHLIFESKFSHGDLIDISKKFMGFEMNEILQEIEYCINNSKFQIRKENNDLMFSFSLGMHQINLLITLSKNSHSSSIPVHKEPVSFRKKSEQLENLKQSSIESNEISKLNNIIDLLQQSVQKQVEEINKIILTLKEEITGKKKPKPTPRIEASPKIEGKEPQKPLTNPLMQKNYLSSLKLQATITAHTNKVNCICLIGDSQLASCSEDRTIKVHSLKNYQCKFTLMGHIDSVLYITPLKNGYLVSCSKDCKMRIWNITKEPPECIRVLEGHTDDVNKLIELSNDTLASCSTDGTIKIWSSKFPYECQKTIQNHPTGVYSIIELKSSKKIVSGTADNDNKLRLWNNLYECEQEVENIKCCGGCSLMETEDNKILVGGKGTVSVVDSIKFQLDAVIKVKATFIWSFISFGEGIAICSCDNNKLIHLNFKEGKIINFREKMHSKAIKRVLFINNTVISCSNDETIKVWS